MKTWIKRMLFAVAGATLVLGTLSACGHRGDYRHSGWSEERITQVRGKAVERISRKLELNADQRQKLAVLADELLEARRVVKGEGPNPREAVQSMVAGRTFDRQAAQTLIEEKTQAVQLTSPKLVNAMADFYDSLSAAQQTEVRELMSKRRGWH